LLARTLASVIDVPFSIKDSQKYCILLFIASLIVKPAFRLVLSQKHWEQVQPARESPCLTPLKTSADILSRLDEVWVKQFVIDSTVTIA
jgi:hypothetical protein